MKNCRREIVFGICDKNMYKSCKILSKELKVKTCLKNFQLTFITNHLTAIFNSTLQIVTETLNFVQFDESAIEGLAVLDDLDMIPMSQSLLDYKNL